MVPFSDFVNNIQQDYPGRHVDRSLGWPFTWLLSGLRRVTVVETCVRVNDHMYEFLFGSRCSARPLNTAPR